MSNDQNDEIQMDNVFLCFSEKLSIHHVKERTPQLVIKNEIFTQDGYDSHGFYDWLRNSDGLVVGVRYDLFETHLDIRDELLHWDYVYKQPTGFDDVSLLIFFTAVREFDESCSADQSLTGDYVYRSKNGKLGISFQLQGSLNEYIVFDINDIEARSIGGEHSKEWDCF